MKSASEIPRIGRYLLLEKELSRGLAETYVARHWEKTHFCFLRCLHPDLADDSTALSRFMREAALAGYLKHPNILPLQGVSFEDAKIVIAYDFFPSVSLRRLIEGVVEHKDHLPADIFVYLAQRILRGLRAAHEAKKSDGTALQLIHRDLSPENIQIGFAGEVRVAGFGAAKANIVGFQTQAGAAVGTLQYLSPEQAQGLKGDQRIDVYGVAALLYELLTLEPLVAKADRLAMLSAIAMESPPEIVTKTPIPEAVKSLILSALSKDPNARPGSVAEFHESFAEALSGRPSCDREGFAKYLAERIPVLALGAQKRLEALSAKSSHFAHLIDQATREGRHLAAFHEDEATIVYESSQAEDDWVLTMPGTFLEIDGDSVEQIKAKRQKAKEQRQNASFKRQLLASAALGLLLSVPLGTLLLNYLDSLREQPSVEREGVEKVVVSNAPEAPPLAQRSMVTSTPSIRPRPVPHEIAKPNTSKRVVPQKRVPSPTKKPSRATRSSSPTDTLSALRAEIAAMQVRRGGRAQLSSGLAVFQAYCEQSSCNRKARLMAAKAKEAGDFELLLRAVDLL